MTSRKKNPLLAALALLTTLAAWTGVTTPAAHAEPITVSVGPIYLSNLTPYAGKYVQAFLVKANEAMLGLRGYQLEFSEIKASAFRVQIDSHGEAVVPLMSFTKPRYAVGESYTHLFVAVTEAQPDPLYLRNRNGVDGTPKPILDPRIRPEDLAALPDSAFHIVVSGFATKITVAAHTSSVDNTVQLNVLTGLTQPKSR